MSEYNYKLGILNPEEEARKESLVYGAPSLGILRPEEEARKETFTFRAPSLGILNPEEESRAQRLIYGEPAVPQIRNPLAGLSKEEQEKAQFNSIVSRALLSHQRASREREILRDQNYMQTTGLGTVDPNQNYEFEESRDGYAELRRQMYKQNDPEAAFLQPDTTIADPKDDSKSSHITFRNVVNFMFSDEMGLLGLKWDEDSFTWNYRNFRNQLSEHPYSTAFTLASYIVPIGAAWMKGSRIARRGIKLAEMAGETAEVAKGRGILGSALRFRFDDHAKLVQTLAMPDANDGRKLFSDEIVAALKKATSPEEIADIVSPSDLNKMLISDWHQERFFELANLAKQGKLEGIRQKASWAMWRKFGNKYFEGLQDMNKANIDSLDEFYEKAGLGRYLAQSPTRLGDEGNKAIYKFWLEGARRNKEVLAKKVGSVNADWAERIANKWEELFLEQAGEGFIDSSTLSLFMDPTKVGSRFHLPAIKIGTAGFEEIGGKFATVAPGQYGQLAKSRGLDVAKALSGPTTKNRAKFNTMEAVLDHIDELETNPAKLTVGGFIKDNVLFQMHRNFRDIIVDATENPSKWGQLVMPPEAYDALPKYAKKLWISFDDLDSVVPGLAERMGRMVNAKVAKEGLDVSKYAALPAIDRAVVKQFFGSEGSARQVGGTFAKFFELLTAVHKTSRTALNIPTHISNISGNMIMLAMAGMNPFSAQALNDGRKMTKVFTKLARELGKKSDETIESLMTKENLIKHFGEDRFITNKLGSKVDLAEVFADPLMKELIETQAFDRVEGFNQVNNILKYLTRLESDGWGSKTLETTARAIAGVSQVPGIKQTLRAMSSTYLAEDMIPKMIYANHLLRKGWGRDSIIREIGRRLPQYKTVGQFPQKYRRLILPWITFPAEATRIMKNNMMDSPITMMAWMQAPHIAQSIVSGAGLGPDFSDYEDVIKSAPPWSVRYQTVMVNGEEAPEMLGAVGGAGIGGLVGAAVGGAPGALVGAAAGGAGGYALGRKFGQEQDELREFNRAWTLDFLPHSAIFPTSTSPYEWEKILPSWAGGTPTPGVEVFQTAKDLTPVEPFAVFLPLLELWSGRGSFGAEIESRGGISFAEKMALGLLGHISPPVMQKYGMKLEGPVGNPIAMADIFEANGGQMTLPKALTATFGGLSLAGLTFLGARTGLGAPLGAAAGAAALSGLVGAGAGAQINTQHLMTDLGIKPDRRTEEYGDWTLDFFANSFFGLNKSWKASAAQALYNQNLRNKRFEEMRKVPVKEWRDAISSGSESRAIAALSEIKKTYGYEWGDTQIGDKEFLEWAERTVKSMDQLPIYAGMSEERIVENIQSLKAANAEKRKIIAQQLAELRSELQLRNLRKVSGLRVVRARE